VRDGDLIKINIPERSINVELSNQELDARRAAQDASGWEPAEDRPRQVSPALKAYALMATSADRGAVRDVSRLEERD
jgi:dihydroxy-acid dehydratase